MAEETFEIKTASRLIRLSPERGRVSSECEMILPEYKEGIHRILRPEAQPVIRSKNLYLQGGTAVMEVQGTVRFRILYFGEEERDRTQCFSTEENFSHTFRLPVPDTVTDESSLCGFAEAVTENLSFRLMGPRRVVLKAELHLLADIKVNENFTYVALPQDEDVCCKGKERSAIKLLSHTKEECRLEEEIRLPKSCLPVGEIVSLEAGLFADRVKCENGGVTFRVLCDLNLNYLSPEEKGILSVCQPMEITKRLALRECEEESNAAVLLSVEDVSSHVEVDESGENRIVFVSVTYTAQVFLYGKEEFYVLEDAFSTRCGLELSYADGAWESFVGNSEFSLDRREEIEYPTDGIVRCEAVRAEFHAREAALSDGAVLVDGKLHVSCLGVKADGDTVKMEGARECRIALPQSQGMLLPDGECRIELSSYMRSPDLLVEDGKIKLRFELCGSTTLFVKETCRRVASISRGEAYPRGEDGIVYLYPEKGEDLWNLCKKYRISPEQLREENALDGELLPSVVRFHR